MLLVHVTIPGTGKSKMKTQPNTPFHMVYQQPSEITWR